MAHFGERDAHIPLASVGAFRAAQPAVRCTCTRRSTDSTATSASPTTRASAALARERTLALLREHVG